MITQLLQFILGVIVETGCICSSTQLSQDPDRTLCLLTLSVLLPVRPQVLISPWTQWLRWQHQWTNKSMLVSSHLVGGEKTVRLSCISPAVFTSHLCWVVSAGHPNRKCSSQSCTWGERNQVSSQHLKQLTDAYCWGNANSEQEVPAWYHPMCENHADSFDEAVSEGLCQLLTQTEQSTEAGGCTSHGG